MAFMHVFPLFWISARTHAGDVCRVRTPKHPSISHAKREIEAWGEDKVLTAHMGVAYSSGLSKNGSWADHDAVVPVMKVVTVPYIQPQP